MYDKIHLFVNRKKCLLPFIYILLDFMLLRDKNL
jgi:hypothetical protein